MGSRLEDFEPQLFGLHLPYVGYSRSRLVNETLEAYDDTIRELHIFCMKRNAAERFYLVDFWNVYSREAFIFHLRGQGFEGIKEPIWFCRDVTMDILLGYYRQRHVYVSDNPYLE